jgi:hypothetical protein
MPLVLLILGAMFLIAAVRGADQTRLLMATLKDDFSGPNNFIYWGLAVWAITSLGYIKALKPISNAFIVLVVLVIFLSNKGFFEKFMQQIGSTQTPSSGGGGILGDVSSILGGGNSLGSVLNGLTNSGLGGSGSLDTSGLNASDVSSLADFAG